MAAVTPGVEHVLDNTGSSSASEWIFTVAEQP
jgi:hypothetical protein